MRMLISPCSTHAEMMLVAQNQQFFKVVHVIEAAKGGWMNFNNGRCPLKIEQTLVQQLLPDGKALIS